MSFGTWIGISRSGVGGAVTSIMTATKAKEGRCNGGGAIAGVTDCQTLPNFPSNLTQHPIMVGYNIGFLARSTGVLDGPRWY